jgi:hypothetical protein
MVREEETMIPCFRKVPLRSMLVNMPQHRGCVVAHRLKGAKSGKTSLTLNYISMTILKK